MKLTGSFISGLLTGAVIGGAIALLFAPQSGEETREKLKGKFDELEKEFETLKEKASQKSGQIKDDLSRRLADLQEEIQNLSKSV
jgi:gas vesicle protein